MSSDIDIEEHNVLDHPTIKQIFPDITSIKTEVIDVEEECMDDAVSDYLQDEQPYMQIKTEPYYEDVDYFHTSHNKIILGTKPRQHNIDSIEDDPKLNCCPKVVLTDWKYILHNNSCYCQQCDILFPTQNTIDAHKMAAHSLLVVVSNNTAYKSTTKLPYSNKAVNSTSCSNYTGTNKALKSTSKQNIKYDKVNIKIEMDDVESMEEVETESSLPSEIVRCPICSCYYINSRNFTIHCLKNHKTNNLNPIVENFDPQCRYCKSRLGSVNGYNVHVYRYHPELCTLLHKPNIRRPKFEQKKIKIEPEYGVPNFQLAQSKPGLMNQSVMQLDKYSVPVPIGVIFKCDKCTLHFPTGLVTFFHSVHCVKSPGEWTCPQCDRHFRKVDKNIHKRQHNISEDFTVIPYSKDLPQRVVCRCLNCGVCYDERNFEKYHGVGCGDGVAVPCPICNLKIHESTILKHKNVHAKNLSIFIVDYAINDVQFKPEGQIKTPKLTAKKKNFIKNSENRYKASLYCCTKCDTYFRIRQEVHVQGGCGGVVKRLCKICGLTFSQKGYLTHLRDHEKRGSLRLKDYQFLDMETSKIIKPPMPKYFPCNKCHVKFFGRIGLRGHTCYEEKFKRCPKCKEEFSDLAYKLHLPFHDYELENEVKITKDPEIAIAEKIPELIKKYQSMQSLWNIVYHCIVCDIVLDNYDVVVEHCQNHFCNMESYGVNILHCKKCDLQFDEASYERHEQLHMGSNIDRTSLQILAFDFSKLLTDEWLDIFTPLSKDQRRHIIAKSIYDVERGVRMELEQKGPSNPTLYRCATCETVVESSAVLEHAQNQDACTKTKLAYNCSICDLPFFSERSKFVHEYYHESNDFTSLRLVRFNDRKDYDINYSLSQVPAKDSLKFIWCQQCGVLVKKVEYKKHLYKHNISKTKPTFKIPKKVPKVANKQVTEKYVFYQCVDCKGSVLHVQNVKYHACRTPDHYTQCKHCGITYLKHLAKQHERVHIATPKMNKNTVKFIKFKEGSILSTNREILTQLLKPAIMNKLSPSTTSNVKMDIFQCRKCSMCVHQNKQKYLHSCTRSNMRICHVCNLGFRGFRYHMSLHDKYPNLKRKDFNVIPFVPSILRNVAMAQSESVLKRKMKLPQAIVPSKKLKSNKRYRTRMSGDLNQMSDDSLNRTIKVVLYKCECNLLFVRRSSLLSHVANCSQDRVGVRCRCCKLVFHKSSYREHRERQLNCSRSLYYYITTLQINCNIIDDENRWLQFCRECGVYYATVRGVVSHFEINHKIKRFKHCSTCDVKFSVLTFHHHQVWHHDKYNCTIKDINIETYVKVSVAKMREFNVIFEEVTPEPDASEDNVSLEDSKANGVYLDDDMSINDAQDDETPLDDDTSICETKDEDMSVDDADTTYGSLGDATTSDKIENVEKDMDNLDTTMDDTGGVEILYKCEVCSLHYLSQAGIVGHIKEGKHKKIPRFKCKYCKLYFTKSVLFKHRKKQHVKESETQFCVISSSEVTGGSSWNMPINFARCLYKCGECDLHFLFAMSARGHVKGDLHDAPKEQCSECRLYFPTDSIARHKSLQHLKFRLKLSDFIIKVIDLAPEKAHFTADTNKITINSGLAEMDMSNDKQTAQFNLEKFSQLFKCAECDVYFVLADMCLDHVHNHTALDPTEFIACKMCDLQILCESLGVHMKGHRENSFNIDELVVTEYRPVMNGTPETDTYLAAERLKSKLISTTTDCGNDD